MVGYRITHGRIEVDRRPNTNVGGNTNFHSLRRSETDCFVLSSQLGLMIDMAYVNDSRKHHVAQPFCKDVHRGWGIFLKRLLVSILKASTRSCACWSAGTTFATALQWGTKPGGNDSIIFSTSTGSGAQRTTIYGWSAAFFPDSSSRRIRGCSRSMRRPLQHPALLGRGRNRRRARL